MSLSPSQFQTIMRGYEIARDQNRRLAEERREEIYSKIPEFKELDARIADYASNRVRLLLEDSSASASDHENPIPQISKRRKDLLRMAGYPEDYLDPLFTCPSCQDTGYVITASGIREKCACFRRQEMKYLYERIYS